MNEIVVYGKDAQEWLDFTLKNMRERMGWEFPKVIESWLYDFIGEVGFVIDSTSPHNTVYCWDNAYVNGVWGNIEEREWSKEEAKELYEDGNLLFYDEESGYYVERI